MKRDITIIQLATPNIDSFAKYSIASINHYAQKHGYKHQILREQTIPNLHINWTKIDYLTKTLSSSSSEFVLLIDADAIIVNVRKALDDFIVDGDRYEIYMPRDTPFFSGFFRPNAGFILVRKSSKGQEVIDKWLYAAQNEGKHLNDVHPRNQNVYWNYVMPRYKSIQKMLPRHFFRKPWKITDPKNNSYRFIYHATNTDHDIRAQWMKDFYYRFIGDVGTADKVDEKLKAHTYGIIDMM